MFKVTTYSLIEIDGKKVFYIFFNVTKKPNTSYRFKSHSSLINLHLKKIKKH